MPEPTALDSNDHPCVAERLIVLDVASADGLAMQGKELFLAIEMPFGRAIKLLSASN